MCRGIDCSQCIDRRRQMRVGFQIRSRASLGALKAQMDDVMVRLNQHGKDNCCLVLQ